MSGNNVTVSIDANVIGLNTKLAQARAEVSATSKTLKELATASLTGDMTAEMRASLDAASAASMKATAKFALLKKEIKSLTAEKGGKGGSMFGGITEGLESLGKAREAMMALGEAALAAFAVERIAEWGRSMGEAAEKTKHTAEIFGMTVPQVQGLQAVATATGMSLETLTKGMGILDKNMVAAANGTGTAAIAFKALGIDAKAGGSQMQIMLAIADKFHSMADGPKKVALAMQLFGRAGKDMIPVLDMGAEGLDNLDKKSQQYAAGTLDQTAATKALRDWLVEVNEKGMALAETNNETKIAMQGLSNVMQDAFAPVLTEAAKGMNELIGSFIESYREGGTAKAMVEGVTGSLGLMGEVLGATAPLFEMTGEAVAKMVMFIKEHKEAVSTLISVYAAWKAFALAASIQETVLSSTMFAGIAVKKLSTLATTENISALARDAVMKKLSAFAADLLAAAEAGSAQAATLSASAHGLLTTTLTGTAAATEGVVAGEGAMATAAVAATAATEGLTVAMLASPLLPLVAAAMAASTAYSFLTQKTDEVIIADKQLIKTEGDLQDLLADPKASKAAIKAAEDIIRARVMQAQKDLEAAKAALVLANAQVNQAQATLDASDSMTDEGIIAMGHYQEALDNTKKHVVDLTNKIKQLRDEISNGNASINSAEINLNGGGTGNFDPDLTKAPKAKKAKKGGAGHDDTVQKWQAELDAAKTAWDAQQNLQNTSEAYSLTAEAAFWDAKLALCKQGTDNYRAVLSKSVEAHQKVVAAELAAFKKGLDDQLAAAKKSVTEQQVIESQALLAAEAAYGKKSNEYKVVLDAMANTAKQAADDEVETVKKGLEAEKKAREANASLQEKLIKNRADSSPFGGVAAAQQEGAIKSQRIQQEIADLERLKAAYKAVNDVKNEQGTADQIAAKQSEARDQQIANILAVQAAYHSYIDGIVSSTISGLDKMISGQMTWKQFGISVYQSVAREAIQQVEKMASEWIVKHLLMAAASKLLGIAQTDASPATAAAAAASSKAQVLALAGVAGAGGVASMAAAPWPLDMTAPAFGASMQAAALSLGSFAQGTNMLPNDMIAQVHAGERIVPAADNKAMIAALNGGGGNTANDNRRGGDTHLNIHSTYHGDPHPKTLYDQQDDIIDIMKKAHRRGVFR